MGKTTLATADATADAFEGQVNVTRGPETIRVQFCGGVLSEKCVICRILDRDGNCLHTWTSGVGVSEVDGTDCKACEQDSDDGRKCDMEVFAKFIG